MDHTRLMGLFSLRSWRPAKQSASHQNGGLNAQPQNIIQPPFSHKSSFCRTGWPSSFVCGYLQPCQWWVGVGKWWVAFLIPKRYRRHESAFSGTRDASSGTLRSGPYAARMLASSPFPRLAYCTSTSFIPHRLMFHGSLLCCDYLTRFSFQLFFSPPLVRTPWSSSNCNPLSCVWGYCFTFSFVYLNGIIEPSLVED